MQNMFAFEWMFDFLSLGTTSLYRRYMLPPTLDEELESMIESETASEWRRTWGDRGQSVFGKFDASYPDLVPSERLCLPGHKPEYFAEEGFDSGDGASRELRDQIATLEKPTGRHTPLRTQLEEDLDSIEPREDAAITSTSCLLDITNTPHTWGEALLTDVVPPSSETVEVLEDSRQPNPDDMITGQRTSQLECIAEVSEYAESEDLQWIYYAQDENNDLLRSLQQDGRNLVLDSVYPQLAPHIVITPPEYTWDDYYIPSQNRVETQWLYYLVVPPQTWHAPRPAVVERPIPTNVIEQRPNPAAFIGNSTIDERYNAWLPYEPYKVFSHYWFAISVNKASDERNILFEVVNVLQKQQCRANAFHVSNIAPAFRKRYDYPDFVASIERPYRWSDPAAPLLTGHRKARGVTIIDSVMPFTVPHIIISEPPPQDPWTPFGNMVNNPQDCRWGARITVPAKFVTVINQAQCELLVDEEDTETDSDSDYGDEERAELIDFMALGESILRPETPLPLTPARSQHGGDGYFLDDTIQCEEGREFASFLESASQSPIDESSSSVDYADVSRMNHQISSGDDVDEEDDLPPFDEWYTIVQARVQAN